jgi:predicted nucleotidyltransferase
MNYDSKKLASLAESYDLQLILIFGSHAHGFDRPESDIDIAVYGGEVLSETDKVNITNQLSGILHTSRIDLVDIKSAPPLLKREIFRSYISLYKKDSLLLHQLELVSLFELAEIEVLSHIRRERLKEFVK